MLRTLQKAAVRVYYAATSQPHKGRKRTKSFQQIVNENEETVNFYNKIITAASLLRPVLSIALSGELSLTGITIGSTMSTIIIPIILCLLHCAMISQAIPRYNNNVERTLIDPGDDLDLPGGWGDHLKDGIVVLVLTHVLTATSAQFWCILLLLPMRALYLALLKVILPSILLFLKSRETKSGQKPKKKTIKAKRFGRRRTITHWHHFRS